MYIVRSLDSQAISIQISRGGELVNESLLPGSTTQSDKVTDQMLNLIGNHRIKVTEELGEVRLGDNSLNEIYTNRVNYEDNSKGKKKK